MRSTWYHAMNYTWVCPELFQSDITGLIQLYNSLRMVSALYTGNPLNIQYIIHCKISRTVVCIAVITFQNEKQKWHKKTRKGAGARKGRKCFCSSSPLLPHFCALRLCMLPKPFIHLSGAWEGNDYCAGYHTVFCKMVKHF